MKIASYFKEYAHDLTLLRIEENRDRYNGTNKQRSGIKYSVLLGQVDREYYTEYIGILAELLLRDFCDRDKFCSNYCVSTFIKDSRYVYNDQDIKIKRNDEVKRISIKACENTLKANKYAIDNEDVDLIVFILFKENDEYEYRSFEPTEVQKWKVSQSYSPYYELEL